jgi:transketolase
MDSEAELGRFALEIRALTAEVFLRRGFGHLGGSFSIIETLAVLFGKHMRINPGDPGWEGRDRFVLSKGHAGPSYYSTLALKGYFPRECAYTLNENGTFLPSHPDRHKTPGVDCTTGSLGQGLSQAVGMAYGFKLKKRSNRVYCIIGDGECNEGQIWESLQFAAHRRLDNLVILIDNNRQQVDGYTKDVSFEFDFYKLMTDLSFDCQEIDGSSVAAIDNALVRAKEHTGRVSLIVLDTIKGYGIDYFEGQMNNHHVKLSERDSEALADAIGKMQMELGAQP